MVVKVDGEKDEAQYNVIQREKPASVRPDDAPWSSSFSIVEAGTRPKRSKGVNVLEWQNPDKSPVKNLWRDIKNGCWQTLLHEKLLEACGCNGSKRVKTNSFPTF